MSAGQKISSLRKSKGISQEKLAEDSCVSLRTIQRIERGVTVPRPYTLKVIADALGVPLEELNLADSRSPSGQADAESVTKLRLINLAALAILILPLSNIALPLIVWRRYKTFPLVDEVGRRIISFQVLWTIFSLFILICAQSLLMGMKFNTIGRLPPNIFMVYILLLAVNFIFIIRASISLNKIDHRVYTFVPMLF